jgi:L-lactate dehydrogenase complex protein LldE
MRVALFVTCLVDTLHPHVGRASVAVLERLGVDVEFPRAQTCCGQLHFNAGYEGVAHMLARRYGEVFAGYDTVVTPSASCAGHVRRHVPELAPAAAGAAAATFELSQFLVERLGTVDAGSRFTGSLAYHPTCHSLRVLDVGDAPERLLRAAPGVELLALRTPEECCGFGGTFAVRNAAVSSAMLDDKLADVLATGADAVCACDSSCLMHIGGGLERLGVATRALHLAEVLAS